MTRNAMTTPEQPGQRRRDRRPASTVSDDRLEAVAEQDELEVLQRQRVVDADAAS